MDTIKVSDYTLVPGARHRSDGDASAEEFFEDVLKNHLTAAVEGRTGLLIDFDGTWGYASSFISELAKLITSAYGQEELMNVLHLKSEDEPSLIDRFLTELGEDYE
ncbi:MAG TPA: hypothetical protein VIM31_00060 [Candidatus Microsaccharimonas sp.]|jgi:hypothetical protein